jgi:YbbR domain-containing protein
MYRLFRENLGIKLLSLIIALALFTLVRAEKGNEAELEIPVVLSNIADDQVFVGEMPKAIKVLVRDRWTNLTKALERKNTPLLVDLRGFTNESVFVFDREKVKQLLGVEGLSIQAIYPSEFTVAIEPKVDITVPVKLTLVGTVSKGYDIKYEDATAIPSMIKITGAKSAVSPIRELATYPIDVSQFKRDARIEVSLQKPSSKFMVLENDRVRVDVPVQEIPGQKVFTELPVQVRNCPEGYDCSVVPPTVDITLSGPLPTIFMVKDGQLPTEIFVDASDFDTNVDKHPGVRPGCERPVGLKCVESPKSVTLIIQKVTAATAGHSN